MLIVRVVPEEFVALQVAGITQNRNEAHAVKRGLCPVWQAGDFHESREQIHADDGRIANRSWFGDAWPINDQRYASAALVARAFADAERQVRGGWHAAAVVGGEDHDRMIRDAELLELPANAADRLVQAVDHCRICGI